jgi:adenylylsulfate kinase
MKTMDGTKHNPITKIHREKQHGHKAYVLWFTGMSGSGKSTLAHLVEQFLHEQGISTYILDGDNLRQGINQDLGFEPADRTENIRRSAEIAKLMVDAGIVTMATFISPNAKDRENAKHLVGDDNYIEIYINTSLQECEKRDVKGLYKKARTGEIKNMTGISAPYEAPTYPDLEIVTDGKSIPECRDAIVEFIRRTLVL